MAFQTPFIVPMLPTTDHLHNQPQTSIPKMEGTKKNLHKKHNKLRDGQNVFNKLEDPFAQLLIIICGNVKMSKCQDPHYNVFERKSTNFIVTMLASSIGCIIFGNGTRSERHLGTLPILNFLNIFFDASAIHLQTGVKCAPRTILRVAMR